MNFAKIHECEAAFADEESVPVGDEERSLGSLVAEGHSRRKGESHSWAWQVLCAALEGHDLGRMRGVRSLYFTENQLYFAGFSIFVTNNSSS